MKNNRSRDYMKYWKVIRYFVLRKYKLTLSDLDMLFFLYSEEYFNIDKFKEFHTLLGWDKNRFQRLRQQGWIEVVRPAHRKKRKALYSISFKTARLIDSIYNKLEGGLIPTSKSENPIFLAKAGYADKVFRSAIQNLNEAIRQEQCHSHEL